MTVDVMEMLGGIWVLGLRALWSGRSLQPIFKFDGNSEAGIFSVVVASFVKQIFFNLATCVSDCDEMIHIFFPLQTSWAGLEPVIVLSVEYY